MMFQLKGFLQKFINGLRTASVCSTGTYDTPCILKLRHTTFTHNNQTSWDKRPLLANSYRAGTWDFIPIMQEL